MSKPSSETSSVLEALGLGSARSDVYELALTHRSFAFERSQEGLVEHNERLELLGDAVVDLIATDVLYRLYADLPEGELAVLRASIVSTPALAKVAREIGLGPHIRLGRGEEASGGREKSSLLADTFEAVVGAAYLEKGFGEVRSCLAPIFQDEVEHVVSVGGGRDPKGALQEFLAKRRAERPQYVVTSTGPDHAKRFKADVYVDGAVIGVGSGTTKKEAELAAAEVALSVLENGAEQAVDKGAGEANARAS